MFGESALSGSRSQNSWRFHDSLIIWHNLGAMVLPKGFPRLCFGSEFVADFGELAQRQDFREVFFLCARFGLGIGRQIIKFFG